MDGREKKLRDKLARAQQVKEASIREALRIGAELSKIARSQETHRKVVAGLWALKEAERSPEFKAKMMRDLERTLWRDDERSAYGLALLSEAEQEARKPKRTVRLVKNAPVTASNESADSPAARTNAETGNEKKEDA